MRIENAIVLQKQIDKGSHFKLENGVLKTERWLSHALRNLRSTPEEIRERNTALHAAMAAVLRRSSLHDVADAFARKVGADEQIDQHLMSPETRSALTKAISKSLTVPRAVMQAARKIPADSRAGAIRYIMIALGTRHLTESPAAAAKAAKAMVREIRSSQAMLKALRFSEPRSAESLQAVAEDMKGRLKTIFHRELAEGKFENGIRSGFRVDANRQCIRSINKEFVPPNDPDGVIARLTELIEDENVRGLVTLLTFQCGLPWGISSFATNVPQPGQQPWDNPEQLPLGQMLLLNFMVDYPAGGSSVSVDRDKVTIRFDTISQISATRLENTPVTGGRYIAEVQIPLWQDQNAEGYPDFSLKLSCEPAPRFAVPADGAYGWPAAFQKTEAARKAEKALGGEVGHLQNLVHQAAVDYQAEALSLSDECGPCKRLEIALAAPADPGMVGTALRDVFRPLQRSMQPLADAHGSAAEIFTAGHRALIESIDGLADVIRANRGAVLMALGGSREDIYLRTAILQM